VNITLDQAEALDAVARLGTYQKAAEELHKGHSAIMYLLRNLEEQVGLKLLDRSGYRSKMTVEGQIVLQYCRELL
jgi:DNA-binding transcriptional LysR family regulator